MIVDDNYRHALQIFKDADSGGIRLQASALDGSLPKRLVCRALCIFVATVFSYWYQNAHLDCFHQLQNSIEGLGTACRASESAYWRPAALHIQPRLRTPAGAQWRARAPFRGQERYIFFPSDFALFLANLTYHTDADLFMQVIDDLAESKI